MRGQLKTTTLNLLADKPMSGSELVKTIELQLGWKPSYGSIYPLLEHLLEKKLVTCKLEKKKKTYTLTIKGKQALKTNRKNKESLVKLLNKTYSIMKEVYGIDASRIDEKLAEEITEGTIAIEDIHQESEEMKKQIFRIMKDKNYPKHKTKLKKIISETNKKLKEIK